MTIVCTRLSAGVGELSLLPNFQKKIWGGGGGGGLGRISIFRKGLLVKRVVWDGVKDEKFQYYGGGIMEDYRLQI